jgi:hypothetical protein
VAHFLFILRKCELTTGFAALDEATAGHGGQESDRENRHTTTLGSKTIERGRLAGVVGCT